MTFPSKLLETLGFRQREQKVQRPWGRNGMMGWKHRKQACVADVVGVVPVRGDGGLD